MELKDLLLMFVVISICVGGYMAVMTSFNDKYDVSLNSTDFNNTFDQLSEIEGIYGEIGGTTLENATVDEEVGFFSFSKKIWSGTKLLIKTPPLLNAIMYDYLDRYGLGWVATPLYVLISIMVGMLLIYFFWRFRQ